MKIDRGPRWARDSKNGILFIPEISVDPNRFLRNSLGITTKKNSNCPQGLWGQHGTTGVTVAAFLASLSAS